ncbi:MAG: DUF1840 domain-containing protein [Gammaproteobacteria bacterium]|nr:DUF1840 domain-containing protein [Gammaproteobacteria bacterium]
MLITFKSRAYANITMFGDVGLKMLEMMAFGSSVPGAISAEDVTQALDNLEQGLSKVTHHPQSAGAEAEDQPSTNLHTRALPLLELLHAAIEDESAVRWE